MIKIYYQSEFDDSTKKILEFFERKKIEVQKIQNQSMTEEELIHILSLSDEGFKSITKRVHDERIKKILNAEDASTKYMIHFLLSNKQLIKSPIIVDEHRLLIGYNLDEMRQFIPKKQRMIQLKISKQKERGITYGIS